LANVEHNFLYGGDAEITGLSIDSREVAPGDLFFCIKGLTHDSHLFAVDAVKRGAAAVVAERPCDVFGVPVVLVGSSRKALGRMASNFYGDPASGMNLIGVTGTNGKTSVTYYLESILNAAGRKPGVVGTMKARALGGEIDVKYKTSTTPDTPELMKILAAMRGAGATDVCMEVTSHSLALYKVDGLRFKAGVFTNLTQDHLDFHGTMEDYKAAKKRLFALCETGVTNADDAAAKEMTDGAGCGVLTYGIYSDCDIRAADIEYDAYGARFTAALYGEELRFYVSAPVKFAVYNALAAIAAAVVLDIPAGHISDGLKNFSGVPGRFQRVPNDAGVTVVVDYAHTPDGLKNVLGSARELCGGRLICVFGCGGDRDKSKRREMGRIAGELSDHVFVTSDNPRSEEPMDIIKEIEKGVLETGRPYEIYEDRKAAIYAAVARAKRGDTVVVAGKGHEEYQEFKNRTVRFVDAEVAADALLEARATA